MRGSRHSEEQINAILKQAENGASPIFLDPKSRQRLCIGVVATLVRPRPVSGIYFHFNLLAKLSWIFIDSHTDE
jgi:hypothetical protein